MDIFDTIGGDIESVFSSKKCSEIEYIKERVENGHSDYTWFHESYFLKYKGLPIEFTSLKVHKKDGIIVAIDGPIFDSFQMNVVPTISEQYALQCAKKYVGARKFHWEQNNDLMKTDLPRGELVICPIQSNSHTEDSLCLSYKFNIMAIDPFSYMSIYVDAHTGEIVNTNSLVNYDQPGHADTRYSGSQDIYTEQASPSCYTLHNYPKYIHVYDNFGRLECFYEGAIQIVDNDNEWSSTEFHNSYKSDVALDVYWGLTVTYDYFSSTFGRDGLNNHGMSINGYVHTQYDDVNHPTENSSWVNLDNNGHGYLTFGDGLSSNAPDAFVSLDIVAHEYGHGLTMNTAKLKYERESGAISEGLSDIWGACVENYANNVYNLNKNVWLCGDEINLPNENRRNMANPKATHQPNTYGCHAEYWQCDSSSVYPNIDNDYCGVHTNSGVMNYWFYLLCEGGSGTNDINYHYAVEGIGMNKAARIVYNALCNYFTPTTNFENAAKWTRLAAIELFGFCSQEVQSVIEAWKAVGVAVDYIPEVWNVTQTLTTGKSTRYFANSHLFVSHIVQEGAFALYESANRIDFVSGFRAEKGSHIIAQIIDCPENNASSPSLLRAPMTQSVSDTENDTKQPQILVVPNPVSDKLTVYGIDTDNSSYIIYDNVGRLVKAGKLVTPWQINVSSLPRGTYVLRVYSNNSYEYVKFIKK